MLIPVKLLLIQVREYGKYEGISFMGYNNVLISYNFGGIYEFYDCG
jgi:hypothetical protein